MRRYVHIILLLLTAVLLTGCRREPYLTQSTPVLNLTLQVPAPAIVKATVPASDAENAIHDLKIWVFKSSNHELVASLELDATRPADDFPQAGSAKRYSLPVSWDFALERPRPAVDVFVLANSASIGLQSLRASKDEASSYTDVEGALFGDNFFSPSAKVSGVSEETGLPMSGVAKGLSVSGEEPSLSVASVPLERCVSKIRFLFSQLKTVSEDPKELETFSVDKIVLNGGTIPTQEYVFAQSAPNECGVYVSESVEYPGAATVSVSETPEAYAYAGQDGPTYERIISDAKTASPAKITETGTYYLRESARPLSGTIYYTVVKGAGTEAEQTRHEQRPFTMPASNFPRNHTWTVYGYYVSNRSLQLSVNVLPWDKSDYNIDFSTSSLMVTGKLKVLDNSVADISRIGTTDEYNVTLKSNSPAIAYLYVATPKGGKLQVLVNGDADAFDVWFSDEPNKSRETTIDPDKNSGRIDLSIYRKESYQGVAKGKTITLDFVAYTPDGDREIEGASECIDQIFNFILP